MNASPRPMNPAHDPKNESSVPPATGSTGQPPDKGLARDLSELARQLQADQTSEAVLQRVTAAACAEIGAAAWAAVSEITGRTVVTRAASDPLCEDIGRLQYEAGDGPCLTSLREHVTVRADDLAREDRWPVFGPQAAERGVSSMLSVQLFIDGDNLGALNLYAPGTKAFDEATRARPYCLPPTPRSP